MEALFNGLGDGSAHVLILGFESSIVDNFDIPMKKCKKKN